MYGLVGKKMEGLDDMIYIALYGCRQIKNGWVNGELMYRQTSFKCRGYLSGAKRSER